jgi:hypothetical protein
VNTNYKNILLHQSLSTAEKTRFLEIYPNIIDNSPDPHFLILNENKDLQWRSIIPGENVNLYLDNNSNLVIDCSLSGTLNTLDALGRIKNTEIYYQSTRVGIGRKPLLNYKFDISIPANKLQTAFHVGDGSFGFSMGNGTSNGFIPEIIGMGSDENDAGLYFIGRAGNDISSNIPLIIVDGRNSKDSYLENRPIFGITSFNYNDYKFVVDQFGCVGIGKLPEIYKLEIEGTICAKDIKQTSSKKYMEDVDYNINGDLIYGIKPVKYRINEKVYYGFISEELFEIIPSLVGLKNGEANDISYFGLIPLLVKTLQKQNEEIQNLKFRISNIEKTFNV